MALRFHVANRFIPEDLLKEITGFLPGLLIQTGWAGAWLFAFLTHFHVKILLLIQEKYFCSIP